MKRITSKYLIVLGILTLVILGSQLLMQKTIKDSKSDSRIINISGRQRMLSQKLTKAALKLQNSRSERDFRLAQIELKEAYTLWTQSHHDLQFGSKEISVSEMNSSNELTLLFKEVEPHFQTMKEAVSILIGVKPADLQSPEKEHVIDQSIAEITSTENSFLQLMNQITFQYDRQSSAKIEKLSSTEYYLLCFTFVLILLEFFFIFRPILSDSKNKELVISELSVLRSEEKVFSSEQIKQANQRIRELRKLALDLKTELTEKHKEYTFKTTDQMMENLKLKAALEEAHSSAKHSKSFTASSIR
ncbi:MAG: type IV pili methyl-accepting chemotaxis transducer N-terminal domain-containing protein [Marinoscillum sp.]